MIYLFFCALAICVISIVVPAIMTTKIANMACEFPSKKARNDTSTYHYEPLLLFFHGFVDSLFEFEFLHPTFFTFQVEVTDDSKC